MSIAAWLEHSGAQHDVVEWARPYGSDWTRAMTACPRADWLLGIGARLHLPAEALARAAMACVRVAHGGREMPDVALAALEHTDLMLATVGVIKEQRDRIVAELPRLGLEPVPSDANFVLFGHLEDAAQTWRQLLDQGVLVRDVGIPHYLRVTAGTPEETTGFLDALHHLDQKEPA